MFKKKSNKIEVNHKKGIELVKDAERVLIVLNDKTGLIEGEPKYVYNSAMHFIRNLIEQGIIEISDIIEEFGDKGKMIKIKAESTEDAFKQLDKEIEKMKKKISKDVKKVKKTKKED